MGDEISEFFAEVTVENFLRGTSARAEVAGHHEGLAAFQQFVAEQLRAVRTAWIAAETYMQPLVVLASADRERIFIPDDDETLRQFVHRMQREARAMTAIWTFVGYRTMVAGLGAVLDVDRDVDICDEDAWAEVLSQGLEQLGVLWFAERRELGYHTRRHGILVDDHGALGDPLEGAHNQGVPLFQEILGD